MGQSPSSVALHGQEPGGTCPSSLLPSAGAAETDTRCSQPPWPPHRGRWGARCSLAAPGFWNTRLQLIRSWFVVSGAEPGWVWFTVVSWWPARSVRMVRASAHGRPDLWLSPLAGLSLPCLVQLLLSRYPPGTGLVRLKGAAAGEGHGSQVSAQPGVCSVGARGRVLCAGHCSGGLPSKGQSYFVTHGNDTRWTLLEHGVPFPYARFVVAQWRGWVTGAEMVWPATPKIFTSGPCRPWSLTRVPGGAHSVLCGADTPTIPVAHVRT